MHQLILTTSPPRHLILISRTLPSHTPLQLTSTPLHRLRPAAASHAHNLWVQGGLTLGLGLGKEASAREVAHLSNTSMHAMFRTRYNRGAPHSSHNLSICLLAVTPPYLLLLRNDAVSLIIFTTMTSPYMALNHVVILNSTPKSASSFRTFQSAS